MNDRPVRMSHLKKALQAIDEALAGALTPRLQEDRKRIEVLEQRLKSLDQIERRLLELEIPIGTPSRRTVVRRDATGRIVGADTWALESGDDVQPS